MSEISQSDITSEGPGPSPSNQMPAAQDDPAEHAGAAQHDGYLRRTHQLIERAIRRRWAAGQLTRDPDGVFTSLLGAEHIEQLLSTPSPEEPPLQDFLYEDGSPLSQLVTRLHIPSSMADLLAVLLACDTDPVSARLVTYLGGNQAHAMMTVELLFEIVYRPRIVKQSDATVLLHRDLAPWGWLRRLGFVLIEDAADHHLGLGQSIRLHPRVTSFLIEPCAVAAELSAMARMLPPECPAEECDENVLHLAIAALATERHLLIVDGPMQSDRELLVRLASAHLQRKLLLIHGRTLRPPEIVAAFREAALWGALLSFQDAEEALAGEGMLRFRECLEVFPGTVALIGGSHLGSQLAELRPQAVVAVPIPPIDTRHRLWRSCLGAHASLSEPEWHQIAALYNLGSSWITRASHLAIEMARLGGQPLQRRHLTLALRQLFDADLDGIANRVEVTQSWEDLVLPEEVGDSIIDIIERIRYRGEVMQGWGFERKLGRGLGLTVLLSGEPGTGKSMVAGLIAAELGLDLYVVDLARLTSKWLGETEKNLARAFDAAETGHVLLLFDEADTVLGKRTSEVHSANDRYANLETNYILARLEQFQGVAVFTTNLASAIDPAIARRMSFHVQFPFPDQETSKRLWQTLIPKQTPTQGPIDFDYLAAHYELSGGFIRNIVLRAAHRACRDGTPLKMKHILHAARAEYRERGFLYPGGHMA